MATPYDLLYFHSISNFPVLTFQIAYFNLSFIYFLNGAYGSWQDETTILTFFVVLAS